MKLSVTSLCAALVVASGLLARADSAGILPLVSDSSLWLKSDQTTLQIDTPPIGNYAGRIGEYFDGAIIYEMAILLPDGLPDGEAFTSIGTSLTFQLFGKGDTGTLGNVDLYGLGARSEAATLPSDFYVGPSDPNPLATLIQMDLLTPTTPTRIDPNTGFVTTSPAANIALAAYLNAQYAGGANAGKYVFLRFSYDVATPLPVGNNYYEVLTKEAGGVHEPPVLAYATAPIPEPGTVAMIAIAGLGYVVMRRRKAA